MIPTEAELNAPKDYFKYHSEGVFATVYMLPDDTILKIAVCEDGTMEFIEWCYNRMKRFGKGSPEMNGLPEVEAFGKNFGTASTCATNIFDSEPDADKTQGWWCVMPYYESVSRLLDGELDGELDGDLDVELEIFHNGIQTAINPLMEKLDFLFGEGFCNDVHSNNVMWDRGRKQWVITDPNASEPSGKSPDNPSFSFSTSFDICQGYKTSSASTEKKVADWKLQPLRRILHIPPADVGMT